jgi:hypothetical protein
LTIGFNGKTILTSTTKENIMGRPKLLQDDDLIAITGATADSKLHEGGAKWAIVFFIMRNGGRATIRQVNEYMRCDSRKTLWRLFNDGWLSFVYEKDKQSEPHIVNDFPHKDKSIFSSIYP